MSPLAHGVGRLSGWEQLHEDPDTIFSACFAAFAVTLTCPLLLYGIAVPWLTAVIHIPLLIFEVLGVLLGTWLWQTGPAAAKKPVFFAALITRIACSATMVTATFIGPEAYTPLGNRLLNVFGTAVYMLADLSWSALGCSASDHPVQPYRSIWTPLMNASFGTMRFMDVLTDVGFCRILLTQGPVCVWYGEEVPCAFYNRLAVISGLMSFLSMILITAVMLFGGQTMLTSSAGKWFKVAVSANAAIALLEVASVAIAVLKIFSDMRQPAAAESARLRSEAAFALVSCCFTLAGFAANVLTLRSLLALLRSATHTLRRPTRVVAGSESGGVGVAHLTKQGVVSVNVSEQLHIGRCVNGGWCMGGCWMQINGPATRRYCGVVRRGAWEREALWTAAMALKL